MITYCYLVASLPHLFFGELSPISKEAFLLECAKWLSPSDMKLFSSAEAICGGKQKNDTVFLKQWKAFNAEFRGALAKARGARGSKEKIEQDERVRKTMAQKTPLLMEKSFEEVRWEYLEKMENRFFFDMNSLTAYFLKLKILERLAAFNKDRGQNVFHELCEVKNE